MTTVSYGQYKRYDLPNLTNATYNGVGFVTVEGSGGTMGTYYVNVGRGSTNVKAVFILFPDCDATKTYRFVVEVERNGSEDTDTYAVDSGVAVNPVNQSSNDFVCNTGLDDTPYIEFKGTAGEVNIHIDYTYAVEFWGTPSAFTWKNMPSGVTSSLSNNVLTISGTISTPGDYWGLMTLGGDAYGLVRLTAEPVAVPVSVKVNGNWVPATRIWVKVNGNWVDGTKWYAKHDNSWELLD